MSKVYLVGAGPGDPELITVKGRRVLQRAGAVLYDNLAPEELLDLAPDGAERIYVGKKKSEHAFSQEEICRMMVERARAGITVVRLKGGDPFIFGRGGEEMEALVEAGVDYEVVPGVTSALGIAAYAGVPLTHREHTRLVAFATGHHPDAVDWAQMGKADTLVIFMGLYHSAEITRRIVAGGRDPGTPAVVVRWGTRPDQLTIRGTLGDIAQRIEQSAIAPPATIIIGEVAGLRDRLAWYERLPLFGLKIAVTRARSQAHELRERLHDAGAWPILLPLIEMRPPQDPGPFESALAQLEEYDWILFTSANAVEAFLSRVPDLRRIRARICAIGPATAAALAEARLPPDLLPAESVAEGIVEAFRSTELRGKRILLPRAAEARELIPETFRSAGARLDVVEAYRNVLPEGARIRAEEIFSDPARRPGWVTFTSSSAVKNLLSAVGRERLSGVRFACLGPATAATARKHGLSVDAQASEATMQSLVEAIVRTRSSS